MVSFYVRFVSTPPDFIKDVGSLSPLFERIVNSLPLNEALCINDVGKYLMSCV